MPPEFGVWQTVYDCFVRRRDAGVLLALTDGMIADAAQWGQTNLSLVSVDSTVARTHHDAAGMRVEEEVLSSLEKAAEASKGAVADGSPPPLLTSHVKTAQPHCSRGLRSREAAPGAVPGRAETLRRRHGRDPGRGGFSTATASSRGSSPRPGSTSDRR